jgi:hypothetical protein
MEAVIGLSIGFGMLVVVPVIAILTHHQRQMAEKLHAQRGPNALQDRRLDELQAQVAQLTDKVNQLLIQSDRPAQTVPPPSPKGELEERLGG